MPGSTYGAAGGGHAHTRAHTRAHAHACAHAHTRAHACPHAHAHACVHNHPHDFSVHTLSVHALSSHALSVHALSVATLSSPPLSVRTWKRTARKRLTMKKPPRMTMVTKKATGASVLDVAARSPYLAPGGEACQGKACGVGVGRVGVKGAAACARSSPRMASVHPSEVIPCKM